MGTDHQVKKNFY